MIRIETLAVLTLLCLTVHSDTILMQQDHNIPECAKWNPQGTICLQCAFRTFYNPVLNICEKVNSGCKTWTLSNGQCVDCFDGYGDALKGGNSINGLCPIYNSSFIPSDPNCKCFTQRGQCKQCFTGFYLNEKGTCNFLIANCTATDILGNCITCQDDMFVDQNGECQILPENCTKAVTDTVCVECNPGFYVDLDGTCEQLPLGCVLANPQGLCTKCGNGSYVNNNGDCSMLPSNCMTADTSGNCLACDRGFMFDSVTSTCELIFGDNCANLNEQGICIQCNSDSYFNEEGLCELLPVNCLEANKFGECIRCALGYEENENKQCGLLPVGCAATNSDGICATCVQGWIKDIDSIECVQLLPGCATGDLYGNCTSCLPGYYQAIQGNCEWLTPNCNKTDNDGVCVYCNDGYTLSNSSKKCQRNTPGRWQQSGYNCRLSSSYNNCTACRKYYTFSNDSCSPTGQNPKCQEFDQNNTCTQCYYPNKYYLDNKNICLQREENCQIFYVTDGSCGMCYDYFTKFNGQCILQEDYKNLLIKTEGCASINTIDNSCDKCLLGWIFTSYSNCVRLLLGCATGDLNGTCRSCLPGYYRATKATCEWLTPNCIKTDTDGLCILCQDGYTLLGDSKECQQNLAKQTQLSGIAPDCRLKNSKGKCTSCRKYYTLTNGTCTPTEQNPKCQIFAQDYICTKCYYSDKYYLDINNICQQHQSNCKAYDRFTGDCTECYSTRTLFNGQCVLIEVTASSL